MKAKCLTSTFRVAAAALFTLSSVLSIRASDYPTTVQSFNPVGYYRLSESVSPPRPNIITNYGSLGAAENAFAYSGIDLLQAQPGFPGLGNSVQFLSTATANNTDYGSDIDAPYNAALNPNGPFTIEFWAKPHDMNADIYSPVCSMANPSRSGWLVYWDGTATGNQWQFRMGGPSSYCYQVASGSNTGTTDTWWHVVCVYDGTSAFLYLNGSLAGSQATITSGRTFNPNSYNPFRIGATTIFGRNFNGWVQHVAMYGSALSAGAISNHYFMATNTPASYSATVLADSPRGYWKLNEPAYTPPDPTTLPITANAGTLGAAARGTNHPGLTAGVAGPVGGGLPGNGGADTMYLAGNVDLGNPDGLNFSNQISLLAWVKPRYTANPDQANTTLRNIVSHGFVTDPADAEVQMRINNGEYEVGSWNGTGEGTNTTGGRATADIGNWVFLAGTYDGTNWRLYRYGQLIAGPSPGINGAYSFDPATTNGNWSIGSRGDTSDDGRFLGGGVDEVAIFTNALTSAQIQTIFNSSGMVPIIIVPPVAPTGTLYEGPSYTFTVEAAGVPTLKYQWTKNGAPIASQTTTSFSLNNTTTADSGTYAIVVTNDYGSITSSFSMTVVAGPPIFTSQPASLTRYAGASASFSSTAVGSPTITYQWYYNTNTAIGGATSTTYTKSGLVTGDAGKYNLRAFNPFSVGGTNSSYATLTVNAVPSAPYPTAALADNPIAYWRLDEASGTVAHDYWGGHDGKYNGVTLSQPGYLSFDPDTAAAFTGANTFVGNIAGIDFSGTGATFSLEAWVNGPANQPATDLDTGPVIIGRGRGGNGGGGVNGWQFLLDVESGVYTLVVEPTTGTAARASAIVGPNGTWQHVVGTYSQANGLVIYVDGEASGSAAAPAGGPLSSSTFVTIGAGQGGVSPSFNVYFKGTIDEPAIYDKELSAAQVKAHFCGQFGSGQKPLVLISPASVTQWIGWPITLSAVVAGSCDLTYQWYKGTTALSDTATITGSQSNSLTISSLALSDAGNYYVSNYNSVGSSNSAVAAVTVLDTPTVPIPVSGLVMHHKFDSSLVDSTGRGNDGTGKHTYGPTGNITTPVNPGPANGGLFEYVTGGQIPNGQSFALKGLHYSSQANADPQQGSGTTYGTNSYYVNLGTRPDLKFSSNVNFSVSYWIRLPNGFDQGDLPFFCDATNSTGGHGFTFATSYGSNGVFAAGTEANSGAWAWSVNGVRIEGPWYSINDAFWHSLVHTYDRSGNGTTYLDGVKVNVLSVASAGDMDQAAPACIGQDPTGSYSETGSADISDLGVWRKALTEVEARGIFVAGTNGLSFVDITPTITRGPGASQVTITWQAGTLQQSTTGVNGSYADVPGPPVSPYTITPTGTPTFYRVRQ